MLVLAVALCGCIPQPFAEQIITPPNNMPANNTNKPNKVEPSVATRKLYVSGAVQNDGYIELPQLCDYKTALEAAGLLDCSAISSNFTSLIAADVDRLIVDFKTDGVLHSSIDVNGYLVTLNMHIDGIEDSVVSKLSQYIEVNGKICNRSQLMTALGDDYADNYYKFYIDIYDYA